MIPDIPYKNDHAGQDFVEGAAAVMIGAYIGHQLDKTKAGRWVNESPTADAIVGVLKVLTAIIGAGLTLVFIWCLLTV